MSAAPPGAPARRWDILVVFLVIVGIVAVSGSLVTAPKIPTWYASLAKPSLSPPNWVFGPVWTFLYAAMAVAAWRIALLPPSAPKRMALAFFFVQLALNAAWPQVFFGLESPHAALAVIAALALFVALTAHRFIALDVMAGLLMAPYVAWVVFAAYLNLEIAALN